MYRSISHSLPPSFSDDPLIKWLRPNATPWRNLEPGSVAWQQRRIQRASVENIVVALKEKPSAAGSNEQGSAGLPAVGILCPPQDSWPRYFASLGSRLWLSFLDSVSAVHDEGVSLSRVEAMMANHERGEKAIKTLTAKQPWYIEVVAVDPAHQGKKLGSRMMKSLMDMCPPGSPVYLECTDAKNVGFYEKFGFKTVEEVTLKDPEEELDAGVKLWLMARV